MPVNWFITASITASTSHLKFYASHHVPPPTDLANRLSRTIRPSTKVLRVTANTHRDSCADRDREEATFFAPATHEHCDARSTLGVGAEEKNDQQAHGEDDGEANLRLPAERRKRNAFPARRGRDQQVVHKLTNEDAEGDGQLQGRADTT